MKPKDFYLLTLISITIPESYLTAAGMTEKDLKLEITIIFYQRKDISVGKAAQLAGISRYDFQQEMKIRQIPVNYDVAELMEDVKTLEIHQ
ncbi:MAG: UPF0175 family protein [Bacteroidota bacterium]